MRIGKNRANVHKLKRVNKNYIVMRAFQSKAESRISSEESIEILHGLTKPFLDTYYVDLLTNRCKMVGMNCICKFTEHLEGNYDQILKEYVEYSVYKEDREMVANMASREYVKEHLTIENPYYYFTYRRQLGDTFRWYRMYLILSASTEDGRPEHIVIAFMDVSEEGEIEGNYHKKLEEENLEQQLKIKLKEDKVKKKYGLVRAILAGIVPLVCICIAVVVLFYNSLEKHLYSERLSYITDCSNNITNEIESMISMQWNLSGVFLEFLEMENVEEPEELYAQMQRAERLMMYDRASVVVLDDEGNCYNSKGDSAKWEMLLPENSGSGEGSVMITQMPLEESGEDQVVFLTFLQQPVVLSNGTQIVYFAFVRHLTALKNIFVQSGFEQGVHNFIVNYDGDCLYSNSELFSEGDSAALALSRGKFLHGASFEQFQRNLKHGISDSIEIRYQGTDYFVSTVPFSNNDWMLLFLVPDASLNMGGSSVMHVVLPYACIIVLVFILLSVFVIYMVISSRSRGRLQRYQELSNLELEKLVEQANAANLAKSEFLTHMSHDIRTPINGIIGMTDIALKNVNNPERVKDCLSKVSLSTGHLLSLVNDVLDMSQIGNGKVQITNAPMDVRMLFENCNSIIKGQLLSKNVQYDAICDNIKHPDVFGDEFHLRQLLLNILDNAVKFTPDGGKIMFRVEELECDGQKAKYRFVVQDTGVGMSEEFQEHIFEQFSQENAGMRTNYKGTGLGMAITKEFIDRMGGTIEIKSKIGEGSTFTVLLQFEIDESAAFEEKMEEVVLSGMNVLLVEDNELNMEIAQVVLEEESIVVTCAENGQIAFDIFNASELYAFDAILMDIMMPVMDGIEAARAIRALNREDAKTVPIIAMTANAYAEDARKVKEAGMNVHLAKPVEPDILYATLAQYKRQTG